MKKQEKIDALKILRRFVRSEKFGIRTSFVGLCHAMIKLTHMNRLSYDQYQYLIKLIPERRPYNGYCWKYGLKKPRIDWINEKIKALEKK